MKKWMLVVLVLAGSVSWGQAQIKIGNRTINTKKVLNAASEVASAITLSDEDVAALCRESVKWMDEQNPVSDPGSAYSKRLDSLMKKVGEIEGLKLNYKYPLTRRYLFAYRGRIRIQMNCLLRNPD